MTFRQHARRLAGLMAVAAGLLVILAARAAVIYADGLRYIRQSQCIANGKLGDGRLRAVDHPGYPLSIALMHGLLGGPGPAAWERAAQAAAVLAGVFLIVPLYLIGLELFGPGSAGLRCLLFVLAPVPHRILADTLSEGTFPLPWSFFDRAQPEQPAGRCRLSGAVEHPFALMSDFQPQDS